jgi:hypothetical protein
LPALRLTKEQCECILAPILHYCLPAMRVCRQFPRKLVFSTLDYLGLNFLHLYYLQEIARIKDIIFHTFNDSLTGKLYKSSMELFFIELGIDPQYSCLDPNIIEALTTPTLIKSTMLFLIKNNIQIKHPISILPQREHDQFIMTVLLQFPIPIHELLACNQCRLFLKAWFISDIATIGRQTPNYGRSLDRSTCRHFLKSPVLAIPPQTFPGYLAYLAKMDFQGVSESR